MSLIQLYIILLLSEEVCEWQRLSLTTETQDLISRIQGDPVSWREVRLEEEITYRLKHSDVSKILLFVNMVGWLTSMAY